MHGRSRIETRPHAHPLPRLVGRSEEEAMGRAHPSVAHLSLSNNVEFVSFVGKKEHSMDASHHSLVPLLLLLTLFLERRTSQGFAHIIIIKLYTNSKFL
ncbi:hypothetical protein EUGRSUZ_A00152 [Eucalyptus grandis]|uniref:Uncharacterized protein n=2 Tax=Eucalyptus grandis TaxID=71139 RepID=A0ACC3LZV1_EUCGR|nr:hypothetical protein EUGRSUZ_A00152 [Eucalyptus grandis]